MYQPKSIVKRAFLDGFEVEVSHINALYLNKCIDMAPRLSAITWQESEWNEQSRTGGLLLYFKDERQATSAAKVLEIFLGVPVICE